jgi:type IV secretion system protein TrbL
MKTRVLVLWLFVWSWASSARAQAPVGPPPGLSLNEGVVEQFHQLSGVWFFNLFPTANQLFLGLATLEFLGAAIRWRLAGLAWDGFAEALYGKILFIGFGYVCVLSAGSWMPAILDSFVEVGQRASGIPGLNPNTIFLQGLATGILMLRNMAGWGLFNPYNLLPLAVGFLSALVVIGSFAWLAAEIAVALIEAYLVMGGGVFLLAFSPFHGTSAITERFLGFMVAIGLKIFTLYLIVGAGAALAPTWGTYLSPASLLNFINPIAVAVSALLFATFAIRADRLAASVATGSVNFGAGDVLRATATMARTALAGSAAASIAMGAARVAMAAAHQAVAAGRGRVGVGKAVLGSVAGALHQEAREAAVPRLNWMAQNMNRRAANIRAGKGNTP